MMIQMVLDSTQWMMLIILTVVTAIPAAILFERLGFSRWWALTLFVPIIAVILLWYLAFARWPIVVEKRPREGDAAI